MNQQTHELIRQLKIERKQYLPVGSNPGYYRLTGQIQYLRHREKILKGIYAWREKNKERICYERKVGMAYRATANRKALTPEQRIARNAAVRRHTARNPQRLLRNRIERSLHHVYRTLSQGKIPKTSPRSVYLLGCTIPEFRDHIQSQLIALGFSWSDWKSLWTMDHVVHVKKFNLPDEERSCWHYTNLRPLPKAKNTRGHF